MEAIEFLLKNPNKWFTIKQLQKIEKTKSGNVSVKLRRIYNSKWKELYGLENKLKGQVGYWRTTENFKKKECLKVTGN